MWVKKAFGAGGRPRSFPVPRIGRLTTHKRPQIRAPTGNGYVNKGQLYDEDDEIENILDGSADSAGVLPSFRSGSRVQDLSKLYSCLSLRLIWLPRYRILRP